MTKHPWRHLREQYPEWSLSWERLPDGILGLTLHDECLIVLDRRQLQSQRRVTLLHELVHVREGHRGHCNRKIELAIEQEVARELISLDSLGAAYSWAHNLTELADELWVDEQLVLMRIEHLHPAERAYLKRRVAARDNEESA